MSSPLQTVLVPHFSSLSFCKMMQQFTRLLRTNLACYFASSSTSSQSSPTSSAWSATQPFHDEWWPRTHVAWRTRWLRCGCPRSWKVPKGWAQTAGEHLTVAQINTRLTQ